MRARFWARNEHGSENERFTIRKLVKGRLKMNKKPKFMFGDIVVVDGSYIGCIVKTWGASISRGIHYEVYVRSFNAIKEYDEGKIVRYIVSKELDEEEEFFYQ